MVAQAHVSDNGPNFTSIIIIITTTTSEQQHHDFDPKATVWLGRQPKPSEEPTPFSSREHPLATVGCSRAVREQ
ncbi:peptidoglycan glycosyltransferase [Anopheles sinensis]|uniref:Peptidoglycan glycosyltransferase n=1 Tax=Anopheles sinensis TaxID=74873 RepID=A0A084VYV8_ANOSI|nr:peptidoglycan glycosyltransferase [Anopheles sinensis]